MHGEACTGVQLSIAQLGFIVFQLTGDTVRFKPEGLSQLKSASMAASGSKGGGMTYTPLSKVYEEGKLYNVWAAVVECSAFRPTKGSDHVCNIYLIDESVASGEERCEPAIPRLKSAVELLFFSSNLEVFPKLRGVGDIIRFHRVKCGGFGVKRQLIASLGFGKPCRYCLFDGRIGATEDPYQRSSLTYTMDREDSEKLQFLRAYFAPQRLPELQFMDEFLVQIDRMRAASNVDTICKVVAAEGVGTRKQTFYIWDGTDAFPYNPTLDWRDAVRDYEGNPLAADLNDEAVVRRRLPRLKGRGAVENFPMLGSVVPVTLYRPIDAASRTKKFKASHGEWSGEVPIPEPPTVGSWVKLRNVNVVSVEGQLQILYHQKSKWSAATEDRRRVEEYNRRKAADQVASWAPETKEELMALWTDPRKEEFPHTPLRRILGEAVSGEEKQYRCLVRVIAHQPKSGVEFCRRQGSDGAMEFCVKLCLQDATGELDAMLLGEHGSAFFQGCPQQDFHEQPGIAKVLETHIEKAEGMGCTRPGGAWMECCVWRVYPSASTPRSATSARYKIVDTVLVA